MTSMTRKKQLPEAPLTEIEKVRARTMTRNNRMFQSLGIGAIASMIRKSNEEGSATCDESASAITHGRSSDYNPNDEVIDGVEVDDIVVKKNDKVSRNKKRSAVRKTKRRKGSETSTLMAPRRIFAVPPGGSKRLLELDEPAPTRVTRSKGPLNVPNHEDSQVHKDQGSSQQTDHASMDGTSSMDLSLSPSGESQARMDLSPSLMHDDEDEGTTAVVEPRVRKGSGLERMTKSLGTKVKIQIAEGMKRPEKPLQAAKFATEGGLAARTYTPVLPHFKDYKKNKTLMDNYE